MSAKFSVFMACDKANHICDKSQYKEASLFEKIKLNMHLIYCSACRKHSKNNSKLTKIVKISKVRCLDKKQKVVMKKKLDKAIKEQSA